MPESDTSLADAGSLRQVRETRQPKADRRFGEVRDVAGGRQPEDFVVQSVNVTPEVDGQSCRIHTVGCADWLIIGLARMINVQAESQRTFSTRKNIYISTEFRRNVQVSPTLRRSQLQ